MIIKKIRMLKSRSLTLFLRRASYGFSKKLYFCEDNSKVDLIEEYENKNEAINNVYNTLI